MVPPTPDGDAWGFSLLRTPDGALALRAAHHPRYRPLRADWDTLDLQRRIAAGRRQPLGRALGLHKRADVLVIDATAGLGRDARVLAALGARVILLERLPQVAVLLRDAQARADHEDDATARMEIVETDARTWLSDCAGCDAVYLDPMYPEDGKSALPSREMQLLRELAGNDDDALLAVARRAAPRVAVKRPLHAPPLGGRRPDAQIRTTQLRFDLYLRAS